MNTTKLRRFGFIGALSLLCSVAQAADTPPDAPAVQPTDASGNTPLHLAVLRGDAGAVDALLKAGADACVVNAAGATPLHYATGSERMVAALLAHGAPVNAVSKLSFTPLVTAVLHPDSYAVAKRLIEVGADVHYHPWDQTSFVLNNAIGGGDQRTVELLLDRGVEPNPAKGALPIVTAAFVGRFEALKLLLARGAQVNCRDLATEWQPLSAALWTNHFDIARLLVECGADLNARASSHDLPNIVQSAYDDARDPAMVRMLVERGVDINSAGENGETALSFALKRGSDSPLVAYLREAGATPPVLSPRSKVTPNHAVPAETFARQTMVRNSVQRAIDVIQPSSKVFLQVPVVHDQQKCTSCHQQELPNVALGLARERGLRVNQFELGRALHALVSELDDHAEEVRQAGASNLPFNALVIGYVQDDLHANKFPASAITDLLSRALLEYQRSDGSWTAPVRRPPIEDGALVATAWGARALQLYPPAGRENDVEQALGRTRAWLARHALRDLNDRVFQLLGIAWTNETVEHMRPFAERLIEAQSADGGWAQFPTLESDAWATGSAMVALYKAGIPTSHPAYQRGVEFLLRTQFDDGSWWVRSRTIPTQPHFNGGFPHGRDQWISAAGTSWAMIALLYTLEPTVSAEKLSTAKELIAAFQSASSGKTAKATIATAGPKPAPKTGTGAIEFGRDIKPILERSCVGCHSGETPKGSFLLTARESLLKGGQSGEPAIVPGYADDSQLLQYVAGKVEDLEMPPLNRRKKYPALSTEEIERLHTWVDAGAPWPVEQSVRESVPTPTAALEPAVAASSPGA